MKLILDEIQTKLEELEQLVFYGAANSEAIKNDKWNYIVFNNGTFKSQAHQTSYVDTYVVTVVHENWLPEGMLEKVIDKMEQIKGMHFIPKDYDYVYLKKPGTDFVVQLVSLEFSKTRKVCC